MVVRKQQSAMEYLMTYGWSILIIAIVLAALFSLGVFGNSNLGPRAQPNSCRVYRPNGPGTTTNINLEGVCNGELPEYVALLNGGYAYVKNPAPTANPNNMSVFAWVYTDAPLDNYPGIVSRDSPELDIYQPSSTMAQARACFPAGCYVSNNAIQPDTWTFIGFTYSNTLSTGVIYVNGVADKVVSTSGAIPASSTYTVFCIGQSAATTSCTTSWPFNGLIANAQVYNAALDANTVQALYLEGIGGAPVSPQYLAAWWPLNGDTNDYSGNGSNGAATNTVFVSTWTNGYTPP